VNNSLQHTTFIDMVLRMCTQSYTDVTTTEMRLSQDVYNDVYHKMCKLCVYDY